MTVVLNPFAPEVSFSRPSSGGGGLTDSFQMAVRHVLWPQLATDSVGGWSWTADASCIFGGRFYNGSADGEYLEWDNVVLQAGTWEIRVLCVTQGSAVTLTATHDSVDTGISISLVGGGINYNQVLSDTFTVSSKTRGAFRITPTSGSQCNIQQIEIVKTSADSDAGSSLDDLPWVVDCPPISYDSTTGPDELYQSTGYMWGSIFRISSSVDDYAEYKVWLAKGTYTLDAVLNTGIAYGIGTYSINGNDIGTIDAYNSSTVSNVSGSIAGIVVATTGVQTLRVRVANKNASASNYSYYLNWLQFRKTATTGAITATGATYGRETMELWGWFGTGSHFDVFQTSSLFLHYGVIRNDPDAQFDEIEWEQNLAAGTYSVTEITLTYNQAGIAHFSQGGADLGTSDHYSASLAYNVALVTSLSLVAGTFKIGMDTTSLSGYNNYLGMVRLVRTGA